ncbi:MAG: S-methyl-5'-thioadenosine phosphorylase [Myxococcota bacterium]|nr:S-methyl-5'-thioadenosine phosphorylase [Myxococcota bacterium]
MRTLGVIGGSGLYDLDGLEERTELRVPTPWGDPSDVLVAGRLGPTRLLFLARHGRGHRLAPHRVPYRANVLALKLAGAEQILSLSAVGSLKESLRPGDLVVVDQLVDRTRQRPATFFDDPGAVAHVSMADPTDAALSDAVYRCAVDLGLRVQRGGTYVCIDGPQFGTRAESELYRSWGMDVVGMTALPEARLAREAELPYALVALVTDYDCWHRSEQPVSADAVLDVVRRNVDAARALVSRLAERLPDPAASPASRALDGALLTAPADVPAELRARLAVLCPRRFGEGARAS